MHRVLPLPLTEKHSRTERNQAACSLSPSRRQFTSCSCSACSWNLTEISSTRARSPLWPVVFSVCSRSASSFALKMSEHCSIAVSCSCFQDQKQTFNTGTHNITSRIQLKSSNFHCWVPWVIKQKSPTFVVPLTCFLRTLEASFVFIMAVSNSRFGDWFWSFASCKIQKWRLFDEQEPFDCFSKVCADLLYSRINLEWRYLHNVADSTLFASACEQNRTSLTRLAPIRRSMVSSCRTRSHRMRMRSRFSCDVYAESVKSCAVSIIVSRAFCSFPSVFGPTSVTRVVSTRSCQRHGELEWPVKQE